LVAKGEKMSCGGGIEVKFRYENLFSGIHSEIL